MTHPHLSKLATDILRDEPLADVVAPSADDDARALLAIDAAMKAERRRRRRRAAAVAGAVAVAATVSLFVGMRLRAHTPADARAGTASVEIERVAARGDALSEGVVIVRDGRQWTLDAATSLVEHDRIVTGPTGRMALSLPSGTHLVVGTASDFEIAEEGRTQIFALKTGSVRADVAKLHPGERFLIRTSDGEVEVRGTSFEVDVVAPSASCGGGSATRVVVSEGVVTVRSANGEDSVRKGESWPRDCAVGPLGAVAPVRSVAGPSAKGGDGALVPPSPAPPLAPPASPASAAPHVAATATATATVPTSAAAPPATAVRETTASELGAQNALFAEATAARRRGDTSSAISAYDRYTTQYPATPLAESAYVERMRLLASFDPHRGAEAARAYLARYPQGFAAAEAREIAASRR